MADRNLILTGFMGTGKSTVGAEVARRLGRRFVDMDAEIEARAGKAIPRIFAEDGVPAFRRMEAALCKEKSAQQGLVIATGGGALVDAGNRETLVSTGTVVCLTCTVDGILDRVKTGRGSGRPLLDAADPRAEIERLLEARRDAYARIPWQIDTTRLSIGEAAERVIDLAAAVSLPVRFPGGKYIIHIGAGLLSHVGGALRAAGVPAGSRVAVVSNPVVSPLYSGHVEEDLRSTGFRPVACSLPEGDRHKTLETVHLLYDQFLGGGLNRNGTVVSLGGGVTGDVAGFAAATYLRGVHFVQIPTTLLAMVDASVGGKTGVDLPQGKNLVGAFKQPALVLIDPAVLVTLPDGELCCGVAEAIKQGIVGDSALFDDLADGPMDRPSWSRKTGLSRIERALRVKIAIVEADPFEAGQRAVLNLGHTVGHALEAASGYTLRHGEAVAIGIVAATRLAAGLGLAPIDLVGRVEGALRRWGLPVRSPAVALGAVERAMGCDKKRGGSGLHWVLPRGIGEVVVTDEVPDDLVRATLLELGVRRS